MSNEEQKPALQQTDVSGSLPDKETVLEPIQNALYATGKFTTDDCDLLSDGILQYLNDAGLKVVWQ